MNNYREYYAYRHLTKYELKKDRYVELCRYVYSGFGVCRGRYIDRSGAFYEWKKKSRNRLRDLKKN